MATFDDFTKLDIRVGRIIDVEDLPNARYTTQKLIIDFGEEIGKKVSGARLIRYKKQELLGKRIVAVVNFPPRQIGGFMSQVLTLGVPDEKNECVLLSPDDENAIIGGKLY